MGTNEVERALRGPVLGRKNFYGSKSKLGTQVNAFFYSVVDTCFKNGIDPTAYLIEALMTVVKSGPDGAQPHLPIKLPAPRLPLKPIPTPPQTTQASLMG